MPSHPLIFVSYSRMEFYFAESLVLELQQAGHDVWFDLQRLTPGSDWSAGITKGLNDCTALVLVASRSAMQSANVRHEWESALLAGKPIHIIVFEAVTLLPELQQASAVIDMREDFDGGVRRLLTCLKGGECPQDRVPRPNAFNFPIVLTQEVGNAALLFLLYGAVLLIWGGLTAAALFGSPLVSLVALAPGIFVLGQMIFFLYRRLSSKSMQRLLVMIPFMPLMLLIPLTVISFTIPGNDDLFGIGILMVVLLLIPLRFILRTLNAPPAALLRWMPMGSDSGDLRSVLRATPSLFVPYVKRVEIENAARAKRRKKRIAQIRYVQHLMKLYRQPVYRHKKRMTQIRFRLHFDPRDARIADKVRGAMRARKHIEAHDNAEHHILILSKNTNPQFAAALVKQVSPLTPIIADNLLFKDYQIGHLQVVDYRSRNPDVLWALASYLGNPGGGRHFGMGAMPVQEHVRVNPPIESRLEDLGVTPQVMFDLLFYVILIGTLVMIALGIVGQLSS